MALCWRKKNFFEIGRRTFQDLIERNRLQQAVSKNSQPLGSSRFWEMTINAKNRVFSISPERLRLKTKKDFWERPKAFVSSYSKLKNAHKISEIRFIMWKIGSLTNWPYLSLLTTHGENDFWVRHNFCLFKVEIYTQINHKNHPNPKNLNA